MTPRRGDGMVMELDGVPAGDALQALADLPKADAGLPVMLGVGEAPRAKDEREEVTDDEAAAARARARAERTRAASRTRRRRRRRNRVGDESEEGRVGERSERSNASMRLRRRRWARGGVVRRGRGRTRVPRHRERGSRDGGCVSDATRWKSARRCSSTCATSSGAGSEPGNSYGATAETTSGASVAGAVMYTCESGANRLQAANFRDAAPGVALGGGYVAGELAPARAASQSFLQSRTSVLGVFRRPNGSGSR